MTKVLFMFYLSASGLINKAFLLLSQHCQPVFDGDRVNVHSRGTPERTPAKVCPKRGEGL